MHKINTIISGIGGYLPAKCLTNDDMAKLVDTSNEWIVERTGILLRHIAAEDEYTSDLATHALQSALEDAGYQPSALDAIIVATTTPDLVMPSTAAIVQAKVGANCMAVDINAVCSGFIYALVMADGLIQSGSARCVAVVGADTMSRVVDWHDRSTCVLFGDGAGAVIVEAIQPGHERAMSSPPPGIIAAHLHCDGRLQGILQTSGGVGRVGSNLLNMQGREVFRYGIEKMQAAITQTLQTANITIADIDYVIPHQANARMIIALAERMGLPQERCVITVDKHANTAAASIPLALHYAKAQGLFQAGQLLSIPAAGAGFTWGNILLRI